MDETNTPARDKPNLNETVICHQIPKRCMYRESAGRTGKSIDRFIESEIIISRGFIASARKMFGDGYKTITRNLSREYGKQIIEYRSGDTDMTNITDVERLPLFERGVGADDMKAELVEGKLVLTTKHCRHRPGQDVREKIGISATRVGHVGILATCLIRNVVGRKDAGEYAEAGNVSYVLI